MKAIVSAGVSAGASRVPLMVAAFLAVGGVALAADDSSWCNTGLGSADAPLDYSDTANWTSGVVPSGVGAIGWFTNKVNGARYVILPENLKAGSFVGYGINNSTTFLLGRENVELMMKDASSEGQGSLSYSGYGTTCVLLYADKLSLPHGLASTCCSVAADIKMGGGFIRSNGGTNYIRLDCYANEAGGGRTNAISGVNGAWWEYVLSDGQFHYRAPRSAGELTGTWKLTEGSALMTRVGSAHTIAVGTTVTGVGIKDGTFVKRNYGDTAILLSQAATSTVASCSVTFAAQTSHVYQYMPQFRRQGTQNLSNCFTRWGADDTLRIEIGTLSSAVAKGTGFTSESSYPATVVIHDGYDWPYPLELKIVNVEFAEASNATHQGLPRGTVTVPSDSPEITVTNGLTATIGTLTNIVGTLVKNGAGTLRARLVSATTSTGTLKVDAGTLVLTATPDGKPAYVKNLALSAGARLELPPEGLVVANMTADRTAVVAGPGVLTVTGASSSVPAFRLEDGATLRAAGGVGTIQVTTPTAAVAGHPAFWLDATKTDTMTLDGDQLSRWNDCRAGETMFCTTIVRKATYVSGDAPYVKLPYVSANMITNQVPLVWNVPLRNIRAVFLVQNPADGGGVLLGRSDRLTNAEVGAAGAFYRICYSGLTTALVHADYSSAVARSGEYYLNGESWPGTKKGYRSACIHVAEGHFKSDAIADAFGSSYASNPSGVNDNKETNGRLRINEYIIYTNELTRAERLQTAQYLSKKWRGLDIVYESARADQTVAEVDAVEGSFDVATGESAAVTRVDATGGTFTKTGAGTLLVKEMKGGALHVAAGETIVKSYTLTAADVPQGTELWSHFDASATNTFTVSPANGTNFVTKWSDVRGTGGNGITLQRATSGGAYNNPGLAYPWIRTNAVNGLSAYDLGPLAKASGAWAKPTPYRSPEFVKADGSRWTSDNYNGSDAPKLKSIFIFFGSEYGGNSLLGARGNAHYSYGLTAYEPNGLGWEDEPGPIIAWRETRSSHLASYVNYQSVISTRLNGESVPDIKTIASFSRGWDLYSYVGEQTRQTQSLALSGYDVWVNGLLYGELVLYTRCLGQEEEALVTAYLMKKWKGADTPGYGKAVLTDVTVDAGAKLTVAGPGVLTTSSISGEGTIDGALALAADAVFPVSVAADGSVGTLTVSGELDLSKGGTVVLTGAAAKLARGEHKILSASLQGDLGTWTVTGYSGGRDVTLRTAADGLYLSVRSRGFAAILR